MSASVSTPSPWRGVRLGVADLERSVRFYAEALGLTMAERGRGRARLVTDRAFLDLEAHPDAEPDPAAAGLFHVAWRVPDRAALGRALKRLDGAGARLSGAADHGVSEAVYLDDPDGHGIEVYADRPRALWEGRVAGLMGNARLDVASLLAAADAADGGFEADVGHVHLETHDLAASRAFYEDLGTEVMAARPGAAFLAWDGYHHHFGLNVWRHRRRPLDPGRDRIALRGLMLALPGIDPSDRVDPAGVRLHLVPA